MQVRDPVSGHAYLIDPVNKVVHRVPRVSSAPKPDTLQRDHEEPLGTKIISGVTVTGVRATTTHPPSPRHPNDPPVTDVHERWHSAALNLDLISKYTARDGTVFIQAYDDSSTAEPDPDLFQPPAGYQVVDETGPFRVEIGGGGSPGK